MQNNPNGPYDDIFNNLAKIVEDIVRNMPDSRNARIVGYTIITRNPSDAPEVIRNGVPEDDGEIPYEVVESGEEVFITAELPNDTRTAAFADIETNCVRICVDDRTTTIMLDYPVDRIHSYYRVHRGVMDISLKKIDSV
jgi:hypothetical protein|nr:hypothetical protein [uncultured Methanoregula sp.]